MHYAPAVHVVGVDELPEETGLAHAGLPDHGDHLTVPLASPIEGAPEVLLFLVPTNEAREPPRDTASRRVRVAPAPVNSNTSTGSPSPLTDTGPSDFTST